jgi:pantoate--beta-alanine ligase
LEINTIAELKAMLSSERAKGKTIGFVPTMGYFHDGHLTLMREAASKADVVVVSIFVNPTQFGPNEDLDKYPQDLKHDRALAAGAGVDYLFVPSVDEMYPAGFKTFVEVEGITEGLCGRGRPGHFKGVATVVAKLLNIVKPEVAFFGEKDWQQLVVIKRMVADLNMDVQIVGVPTVREADGLAMSSRNSYLSARDRQAALALSKTLARANELVEAGERNAAKLMQKLRDFLATEKRVELEYIEAVDPESLAPVDEVKGDVLIALAARVGGTRLIDNTVIRQKLENSSDLF